MFAKRSPDSSCALVVSYNKGWMLVRRHTNALARTPKPYLGTVDEMANGCNGNFLALDVNAVKDRNHARRTLDPSSPNK